MQDGRALRSQPTERHVESADASLPPLIPSLIRRQLRSGMRGRCATGRGMESRDHKWFLCIVCLN